MPESSIPLHALVAAVRAHPPTKDVVPESFRYDDSRVLDDGAWRWSYEGACVPDEIARAAVEAWLWRGPHIDEVEGVVWLDDKYFPGGAVVRMVDQTRHNFGPDLAAALAFACGVPLPGEDATR